MTVHVRVVWSRRGRHANGRAGLLSLPTSMRRWEVHYRAVRCPMRLRFF